MRRDINPILIRELRGRMRTPRAFWLLVGFLTAVAGTASLVYTASYLSTNGQSSGNNTIGNTVFFTLIVTAMAVLTIMAPVMAAGSIAGERERQTFDLLLTSQLSAGTIIFGKILATLAYCGLLLSAMTPLVAMTFLMGGVDLGELFIMYAIISASVLLFTCCGIYWSTRATTPLTAIGFALATVLSFLFGLPLLAVTIPTIWAQFLNDTAVLDVVANIGLASHPFIAMYLTDTAIHQQQIWMHEVTIKGVTFTLPATWILCIIESWLLSIAFVVAAMRRIWPQSTR
jgi:ABC-type transport system involved in multi-copper enzyme maturation permease subunit